MPGPSGARPSADRLILKGYGPLATLLAGLLVVTLAVPSKGGSAGPATRRPSPRPPPRSSPPAGIRWRTPGSAPQLRPPAPPCRGWWSRARRRA